MTATCEHCQTTQDVDRSSRNEDGSPSLEATGCGHPGCNVQLCDAGCQHLSFCCEGCSRRFCSEHKIVLDGLSVCLCCAVDLVESHEPDCECTQTDVDMFDARGCEFHDSRSRWNVQRRAITAVQEYERAGAA